MVEKPALIDDGKITVEIRNYFPYESDQKFCVDLSNKKRRVDEVQVSIDTLDRNILDCP